MKKILHLFGVVISLITTQMYAQEPNLVQKKDLETTLRSNKTFNVATGIDTIKIPIGSYSNMTVEIKAKINSATGRGLDVDLRKKDFTGFRTSLNTEKLQWTAPLSAISTLNFSSTQEQTIRYAIEGNMVHIYQNGSYINSKNLTTIYDIVAGVENTNPDISSMTKGANLVPNILGTVPVPTQKLNAVGWGNNGVGVVPWNNPNTSGVRFNNNSNSTLKYNGVAYTGTNYFAMLRWESGVTNGSSFYYPVTLEANKTYNLSSLYGYVNNGASGNFKLAISKETTGNNLIAQFSNGSVTLNDKLKLYDNNLAFTTTEAGTYYLLVQNDGGGIWLLGNLVLKEIASDSRIIIGKNYLDGANNMEVTSVTFDATGSYSPVPVLNAPKSPVNIADQDFSIARFINAAVTVSGKSNIHVTETEPLKNSSVNLTSNDSWLYLERVKPSQFLDATKGWLDVVKINGANFNAATDRVAVYASGCVIIPNGKVTEQQALTVYTEANFGGNSEVMGTYTYYNNLGANDNKIKSFKLKKGYAVTLANNADGTGFSKMYVASDADVEITTLPEGFIASGTDNSSFVSFVRVFKWEWSSKKGTAGLLGGTANAKANASIVYDWGAGGNTGNIDTQYVPMRHNLGWDSFETIKARTNVTSVLGYNEPERPDQSNMTVQAAIEQFPEIFKSGLRIGSPAPASITSAWLTEFMSICESLNYRVDFVAFHAYQDQPTSWWDWNIGAAAIGGRPVWITEWNNGANWTNTADASKWPTTSGLRVDVHGNPLLDSSGNQTTVALPLSAANADRQKNKLKEILDYFEKNDLVEHHFLYNWVNDARTLELNGELTPAGEMFGNFNSTVGFKNSKVYDHKWKISPPWVKNKLSDNYASIQLSWYDHNGETGKKYIIERKMNAESSFVAIATVTAGTDYEMGKTVNFSDNIIYDSAIYRVKAVSYKDTESAFSREIVIDIADPAVAPILTGKAISTTIIQLEWNKDANVLSYDIKRATSQNGTYEVIATKYIYNNPSDTDGTNKFTDDNRTASTTYFYKVVGVNSAGAGADSQILSVSTLSPSIPKPVENFHAASSDATTVLTWDFAYDVKYKISRSTSSSGMFTVIADNFDGTRFVDNSGIQNNQAYYYKIQGINVAGSGTESLVMVANPKYGQHARFNFEENNGTKAYDEWGGYHGTLYDKASWIAGKDANTAVTLTAADKSYIQLGDNIISNLTDFTISTWFKTPTTGNTRIFDFGQGTGKYMALIPQPNAGNSRFIFLTTKGKYDVYMPFVFPLNEWVHVAITLHGTEFKYFVNGVLVFADNKCTNTPQDLGTTNQNFLGRSQWPSDPYSSHSYNDFRIYNYALSDTDVTRLSNNETLSVDAFDPLESSVVIYPNPIKAGQDININLNGLGQNIGMVNIYDMLGKLVNSKKIEATTQMTIKAPNTKGYFVVEIKGDNYSKKAKIIVK